MDPTDFDIAERTQKTAATFARDRGQLLWMVETTRLAFNQSGFRQSNRLQPPQRWKNIGLHPIAAARAKMKSPVEIIGWKPALAVAASDFAHSHAFSRITRVSQTRSCSARFCSSNAAIM